MSRKTEGDEPSAPALAPRYLKLDDVAAYLSVSVPQVYSLVRSGELPAIKIGGRGVWRVDRTKLDAYLEQLEKETAEWAKAHPLNPLVKVRRKRPVVHIQGSLVRMRRMVGAGRLGLAENPCEISPMAH